METLPSNNNRSLIPYKKLLISQNLDFKKQSLALIKKQALKYTKHARIDRNDCHKRDLSYLKSMRSFGFHQAYYDWRTKIRYIRKLKISSSQVFQIIKSHKKFIRVCETRSINLRFQKELSLLSEYEVEPSKNEFTEECGILAYFRALKKILFNLNWAEVDVRQSVVSTLQKNLSRIIRIISSMRSIRKIKMSLPSDVSISLFAYFLEIFGSCPAFLRHLKCFSIQPTGPMTDDPRISRDDIKDSQVQTALGYVTHVRLPDYRWFNALFAKEILKNVSSLETELTEYLNHEVLETTARKLSDLKLFTTLKHLDLKFKSFSSEMENVFLESFTLPPSIESVKLTLCNFLWGDEELTDKNLQIIEDSFKNHPRFQTFYHQWANLSHLKDLTITINDRWETRCCPKLASSFSGGILKQVKTLRKFQYEDASNPNLTENAGMNEMPMDLSEFWGCLESSKDSLEDLNISAEGEMKFFKKESLESMVELWNLKSLVFHGKYINLDMNLGGFLMKLSKGRDSTIKIWMGMLCFEEEKQLKDLFADIVKIPKNINLVLSCDILTCSWVEVLGEFMIVVRGEGELNLCLFFEKKPDDEQLRLLKGKFARDSPLKTMLLADNRSHWSYTIDHGKLF